MTIGRLYKFDFDKGYGFLKNERGPGTSLFVHITAFRKARLEPEIDAVYDYAVGESDGRALATNLELIHAPSEFAA